MLTREKATTAARTPQVETEAGAMWSLRGTGSSVTSVAASQVPLLDITLDCIFPYTHSGQVSLGGSQRAGNLGGSVTKGNVYLDGHPICDDGWSREDASVACR